MTISSAAGLLAELHTHGVELIATGDRLRYRPIEKVSTPLLDRMTEEKFHLLALLRHMGRTKHPELEAQDRARMVEKIVEVFLQYHRAKRQPGTGSEAQSIGGRQ